MNSEQPEHNHKHKLLHAKKVFDVVRPGKVPATPSSRPVIVGQNPVVQDRQMVQPSQDLISTMVHDDEELPESAKVLMTHRHSDLKPLVEPLPAAKPESEEEESQTAPEVEEKAPEEDQPEETPAPEPEKPAEAAETPKTPESEPEPEQTEPKADEAPAEPADKPEEPVAETPEPAPAEQPKPAAPKQSIEGIVVKNTVQVNEEEKPAEAEQAPADEQQPAAPESTKDHLLQMLKAEDIAVDSQEYDLGKAIVSHHRSNNRGAKLVLLVLLVILLTLIVGDFALDAELIQNTYNLPHTEILN